MSDDYKVDGLSNAEIRAFAKRSREFLGFANAIKIDVLELESVTEIWTVLGPKPFRLRAVSDTTLPNDSGLTTYDGFEVSVQIPRHIRHDAFLGSGYARFTFAHELGHATLHPKKLQEGASMPRRRLGNDKPLWIPKFQSAEHQATVFAAAFLINDRAAEDLASPDDVAIEFGLSLEAARIYYEQRLEEKARPAAAERVKQKAAEFRALTTRPSNSAVAFLKDPCLACGLQRLFPVGHKFMCHACDAVYDRFQDGDQVEWP
jgi:hypothetical protein